MPRMANIRASYYHGAAVTPVGSHILGIEALAAHRSEDQSAAARTAVGDSTNKKAAEAKAPAASACAAAQILYNGILRERWRFQFDNHSQGIAHLEKRRNIAIGSMLQLG